MINIFKKLYYKLFFKGIIFKPNGSTELKGIDKKNIIYVKPEWDEAKGCYVVNGSYE